MRMRALLFALLTHGVVLADTFTATVVKVTDGDTLTVLGLDGQRHIVRLAGIDAPEKRQPFWEASRTHLRKLADGREVAVRSLKNDRYDRVVATLHVDQVDINLAQVEAGWAWHRPVGSGQKAGERSTYKVAQARARDAQLGLWSQPGAQPPWTFRQRLQGEAQAR